MPRLRPAARVWIRRPSRVPLFVGEGRTWDHHLPFVQELPGHGVTQIAIVLAAGRPVVGPRAISVGPEEPVSVPARIQGGLGMELIALVAAVAIDQPLVLPVRLLDDADVEAALLTHRHGMKLDVGADIWIPVARQDDLFG